MKTKYIPDVDPPYSSPDTSKEAAESLSTPTLSKLRRMVLTRIQESGTKGMTCDALEVALNLSHQTCSARVNELEGIGYIKWEGKRPTRSGRNARIYRGDPDA